MGPVLTLISYLETVSTVFPLFIAELDSALCSLDTQSELLYDGHKSIMLAATHVQSGQLRAVRILDKHYWSARVNNPSDRRRQWFVNTSSSTNKRYVFHLCAGIDPSSRHRSDLLILAPCFSRFSRNSCHIQTHITWSSNIATLPLKTRLKSRCYAICLLSMSRRYPNKC